MINLPKVKICGITNLKDALTSCEAGADALGFVFYKKSPRYISPENAKEIIKNLPPFVHKVGLFVNVEADEINSIFKETKLTLAQIHFEAKESLYNDLEFPYIKVFRIKTKEDLLKIPKNEYILVDAFVKNYGGEGKKIKTEWFDDIDCSKFILAGGLNSQNIYELKKYGFYGFDVSSGVEKEKGKKDFKKIKYFMEAAKNNER